MINDTGNITKEKFEKIFENNRDTISVIKYNLLSELDIEKAKSRNSSLRLFLENAIWLFFADKRLHSQTFICNNNYM